MNDTQLLENFAGNGSESAFRTLVERHLPLVLGTARRLTSDSALAEDVAQTVFILLARKANGFGSGIILSGWLYRTTKFVAARALSSEQRRRRREEEAATMHRDEIESDPIWHRVTPQLDDALQKLGETDRNALLLRFFNQQPMREVGVALGINEEAAKKRVARALEKLREILRRRGAEISVVALMAGLAKEAEAASAAELVLKISTTAVVKTAAGAGVVAGSSALLTDVLAALRWAKIKLGFAVITGLVATVLLIPPLAKTFRHDSNSKTSAEAKASLNTSKPTAKKSAGAQSNTTGISGQQIPMRLLRVTVLDSKTGEPISGATGKHGLQLTTNANANFTWESDSNGVMEIQVPQLDIEQMNQFGIGVRAKDYASREISWLCSTGHVMSLVSTQYTVRLEHGITLSGTVVNDSGESLPGVHVGVNGSNYRGFSIETSDGKVTSPPQKREEDFSEFSVVSDDTGPTAIITDAAGKFQIAHFPSDLHALLIDLLAPDGARQKFTTPNGKSLSADETVEVGFDELKNGTARLIIPRGFPVDGIVVNDSGEPIVGAEVVEASQWGNLKVLSRSKTDSTGSFHLVNRPAREMIFAASAEKYASVSIVAKVRSGMEPVRLQLPNEQPLRGHVVDEAGHPLHAGIQLADYLNEGLGFEWKGETDADGKFIWRGAPTNELVFAMNSMDGAFDFRLLRLRATTNEQLIVVRSIGGTVHIRGKVFDAETKKPVENFIVQISKEQHGEPRDVPEDQLELHGNAFEIKIPSSDFTPGWMPVWQVKIETKDYESTLSREFMFNEGDQELEFALKRGGKFLGTILTPDGMPAAKAQIETAAKDYGVEARENGRLGMYGYEKGSAHTDATGHFELKKITKATALVVYHESGWAIAPVVEGENKFDLKLQPWGRIEGTLSQGGIPGVGKKVNLENLIWDFTDPLRFLCEAKTDRDGHFVFEKLPAREYKLVLFTQNKAANRNEYISTMQTPVEVRAGETTTVTFGSAGTSVSARLRAPASLAKLKWKNSFAMLRRDVALPADPPRSDFVSNAAHTAARLARIHDPVFMTASHELRDYLGKVSDDGVVSFENIPAGNYILEAKFYPPRPAKKKNSLEELQPIGQLRVAVSVPEQSAGTKNTEPIFLGGFTLEPL